MEEGIHISEGSWAETDNYRNILERMKQWEKNQRGPSVEELTAQAEHERQAIEAGQERSRLEKIADDFLNRDVPSWI